MMPFPFHFTLRSKLDGAVLVSIAATGALGLFVFVQHLPQALLA